MTTNDSARTQAFITRWAAASGSERANYQLFVTELCDLLGCPKPDPASDDTRDNAYVFERRMRVRMAYRSRFERERELEATSKKRKA